MEEIRPKPHLLVICGRNKRRSRTAEFIFKNDNRFKIRSAGLSNSSNKKLTEHDINWSTYIFVMDDEQKERLRNLYNHLQLPPIEVLYIADEYEFMDEELVEILTVKINSALAQIS